MGKAADNERLKLRATYLNNIAVGIFVAGGAAPYFTIAGSLPSIHRILSGNPTIIWTLDELFPLDLRVALVIFSMTTVLSLLFHRLAVKLIESLED
jgi:hypothetical protein